MGRYLGLIVSEQLWYVRKFLPKAYPDWDGLCLICTRQKEVGVLKMLLVALKSQLTTVFLLINEMKFKNETRLTEKMKFYCNFMS